MKPTRAAASTAILLTALVVGTSLPAQAKGGDGVRTSGACSAPARWKLKIGPEDGRLEVEAEVDSNSAGQTWRWTLGHDGRVVASGTGRTAGRSGSFEVRRVVADHAGTDSFTFRARHVGTSQTCSGSIRG